MKTGLRATLSMILLGACTPVLAQPAPAGNELDAAYAAFDAVAAREHSAIAARERAMAGLRRKAAAAEAAGAAEARAAQGQVSQLRAIAAEMRAIYNEMDALNARPQRLLLEKAVIEDWYAVLQPAVANLTENSFRALDAVGSSRVDLQACKLEYSIVSPK